jgi:peptidoglycan/LPS O-acetylase OafA/YrhL
MAIVSVRRKLPRAPTLTPTISTPKRNRGSSTSKENSKNGSRSGDIFLAIRGIAAILVVVMHAGILFGRHWTDHGFLLGALTFSPAWLGMGIFFSLSGYLMCSGFLTGRYSFTKGGVISFWVKRFYRIGPVTYLTFVTVLLISNNGDLFNLTNSKTTLNVFFFNFYGSGAPEGAGHLWSMTTEWIFYICIPFILLIISRYKTNSLLLIAVVVGVLLTVERSLLFESSTNLKYWHHTYLSMPGNFDFFLAGILAAIIPVKQSIDGKRENPKVLTSILALYILYTFAAYPVMSGYSSSRLNPVVMTYIFMAILPGVTAGIMYVVLRQARAVVPTVAQPGAFMKFFEFTGRISLPLYLIHPEVFILIHQLLPRLSYLESLAISLVPLYLISNFLSRTIEQHFIKVGNRQALFFGSKLSRTQNNDPQ